MTDANPKYVYPYLGDALGDMMPNQPTRTHYVFKGWNTKADGSGVTVDSTTKIDQATLKDALKEIAGTNTAYETTGGADIFLDYFMLIIQGYVCTLPGSYNREIFLFVLCYTNQYSC